MNTVPVYLFCLHNPNIVFPILIHSKPNHSNCLTEFKPSDPDELQSEFLLFHLSLLALKNVVHIVLCRKSP